MEYEKFLEVEESIRTLLLQAVDEPFLEAMKEEYIGYGSKIPLKLLEHLQNKMSKVANEDKMQMKKVVFIEWKQLQVLLA